MIYLDSSALLKLLVREDESAALASWISERSAAPTVSSQLAQLEVVRAVRRLDETAVPAARALVAQLDLIPLDSSLLAEAAVVDDPTLRGLDAIHLASALSLRPELTAFIAYDNRLLRAAQAAGLPVERPGSSSTLARHAD